MAYSAHVHPICGQPLGHRSRRAQPVPAQVRPRGAGHRRHVEPPVALHAVPRPAHDRALGVVQRQQVRRGLPVAVPQLRAPHAPAERAARHPPHHERAREVQPDDRVGPGPDRGADGRVVAAHHPPAGRGIGRIQGRPDGVGELLRRRRRPPGLVVVGVELDVRHAQPLGHLVGEGRLARPGVPDDHHATHPQSLRRTRSPPAPPGIPWRHALPPRAARPRPDLRRRLPGPDPLGRRLPVLRRPHRPRRFRGHHPDRRGQHDGRRRAGGWPRPSPAAAAW